MAIKRSLRASLIAGAGVPASVHMRLGLRPWLSAEADTIPGRKSRISAVTES